MNQTTLSTGKCPYLHGTVYADPYPGYVHGNPNRGVCPSGCRPVMTRNVTEFESPMEVLLREAVEFVQLYYHERTDEMQGTDGFLPCEERIRAIKESIYATGTYVHTFDELQHGARVAWRNAPKCANRKYWQQLKLLDQRKATSNKEMFDCCIEHLSKAMVSGVTEAYITVFKPATPGKDLDGSYIWNDQLLQYAAYGTGDSHIGDPKNLRFTEMLKQRFGWDGPPDGVKGAHDYLPLIIQAQGAEPELFELPQECVRPVLIHHPQYPELSTLNMQWYPIPVVCALDLTVGGILYTAAPFNGWYATTEVLRDLTDECRYNMIIPVAKALGMETNTKPDEAPLWKDTVINILSSAIYHSFKSAKIAIIDHHTLIDLFWTWYGEEMQTRKYCPVNWKWVIPPMSSSTNRAYLGLNKAQDYTLKPAYLAGLSPFQLEIKCFGKKDTSQAMKELMRSIPIMAGFKRILKRIRERKQPVTIVYASVTGTASKYASDLGGLLSSSCNVSFVDACGSNATENFQQVFPLIQVATLVVFVSSTQGNGELPSLARKFMSILFDRHGNLLREKHCAVLGFGSSNYPIFCGAASQLSRMLAKVNANEIVPHGLCDSVKGEDSTFYDWATNLVKQLACMNGASQLMLKLSSDLKDSKSSRLVQARSMLNHVKVEVFAANDVEISVVKSFMTMRSGSMGTISRRMKRSGETKSSVEGTMSASIERIVQIISFSTTQSFNNEIRCGLVKCRDDIISSVAGTEESEAKTRKTSVVKIALQSCGDPPYQPGDHIRVFPRSIIGLDQLQQFVGNLSCGETARDLCLDDHMFVSYDDKDFAKSELAVLYPLLSKCRNNLMHLEHFFDKYVTLESSLSMQACLDLSKIAKSQKDREVLEEIGRSETFYKSMCKMTGMKWIDLFDTFPSLSKQVTVNFLVCSMKPNHARSYSIASCKKVVGSELHVVVGRHLYSRGGSKVEVGVCSNFLTQVESGDEILFSIESNPSFHYPHHQQCPIVFICTGTGFAPIRGLLQMRSHIQTHGGKLGPSILIFGSRSSSEGLFHDEIFGFQEQGVLTDVFMCYSRERGTKEYTHNKILSTEVRVILGPILEENNTHIFMCGSANMAEDCKISLREISNQGSFDFIIESGRLHCDIFGALTSNLPQERPVSV